MVLSIVVVGLPFVLYSGTLAMVGMFNLPELLGVPSSVALSLTAFTLTLVGLGYALPGGMRGVAMSDLYYAIIFLLAAVLIPILGLHAVGEGSLFQGMSRLVAARPEALNPFGGAGQSLPLSALLTGMIVINLSAWCANQNSAQKAFAASSLAESQKGMLMAAAVKLVAPVFFVLPGMIAWVLFKDTLAHPDMAYATLVHRLLPGWLVGFFAVAVAGATITSVSGLVHTVTTLFEIDLRPSHTHSGAGQLTPMGRWFGIAAAVIAVVAVPFIARQETGFYVLMKRLNATLTIPVVAVVIPAVLTQLTWRPGFVRMVMITASVTYLFFELGVRSFLADGVRFHWLHSVAFAFAVAVSLLLAFGRKGRDVVPHNRSAAVGWRFTAISCWTLLVGVVVLYAWLWWIAH
jgi:SSS family solute:Na+ symporter